MAPPGIEPGPPAAGGDLDAVAVELDLVHPAGPAGRMIDDLAQLDRNEGRGRVQCRLARFRPGLLRPLARHGPRGGPLGLALGDLGQAAARGDRGVDLHIGVALARHGGLVLLLDQQPVVAFRRLAPVRLQPHQSPAAAQPLAVQDHLQRASLKGGVDIRLLRFPFAAVPQLDRARAVVARRDGPLERAVIQRMILDLDRQPLHRRVARRGLGHGPGLQHPLVLDAEVVVKAGGGVALDQIGQPTLAPRLGLARRLGRAAEVPLGPVGVQTVRHVALAHRRLTDAARSATRCSTGRRPPAGCGAGDRRSRRPDGPAPRRP